MHQCGEKLKNIELGEKSSCRAIHKYNSIHVKLQKPKVILYIVYIYIAIVKACKPTLARYLANLRSPTWREVEWHPLYL